MNLAGVDVDGEAADRQARVAFGGVAIDGDLEAALAHGSEAIAVLERSPHAAIAVLVGSTLAHVRLAAGEDVRPLLASLEEQVVALGAAGLLDRAVDTLRRAIEAKEAGERLRGGYALGDLPPALRG